ncbi:S-layer homology domain-containing protein [Lysinibacillus xylanilyticus]|uniref:S-layer homology domain-containing protein n=1 Tax=Lysinibacillus xylanilyticus TaxID=582475 RepID=UPI002B24AB48|nr:S-layer homology domain-containing protein [Lysinibacillus xylanilyticus]MEB2282575.1 S-layer homology domain-containing protein [Lysinibacillus xylanilyticus]
MVKENGKGKKQTRFKTYRNASGKAFMALAIANAAVGGVAGVQEAEAATKYTWKKFEVSEEDGFIPYGSSWTEWGPSMGYYEAQEQLAYHRTQGQYDYGIAMYLSFHYVTKGYYGKTQSKGNYLGLVTSNYEYEYPQNDIKSGYYYEYVGSEQYNTAPTTPTLTVPSVQFEHGDKHFISYGSTDTEGDTITYTLQVNYNNSGNWEQVYKGTQKVYEYIVPKDKTSVQFRVIASDGQESSGYKTSENKSIREVQYYWSKYNAVNATAWGGTQNSRAEASSSWNGEIYTNPEWDKLGLPSNPFTSSYYNELSYSPEKGFYYSGGKDPSEVEAGSWGELIYGLIPFNTSIRHGYFFQIQHSNGGRSISYYYKEKISNPNVFERGSLITNSLQAGYNTYQSGVRNADGYWYERGQRVLSDDVTPPIIELTEQSEVGATSSIDVKVFDLSAIKTFKYAKGEQGSGYFAANGTAITNGKCTVNENGKYTVYAEDARGNKSVQVIEVKKVNTAPVVISAEAVDKFNVVDDSSNFIVQGSISDVDGQPLLAKAIYNGTTVLASTDNNHSFKAMLKGIDYQKGFHNSEISIVANDGIADSAPKILTHTVIKVDNATDYLKELNAHSGNPNEYKTAQQEAFYKAYESILSYEAKRSKEALKDAIEKIDTLKASTVSKSETLTNWQNRLDSVTATVATEDAEQSLSKKDFEKAKDLVSGLTASKSKEQLEERINELQRYHDANDAVAKMEDNKEGVSWDTINYALEKVAIVENADNKKALQDRLTKVIKDFLSDLSTVTSDDLDKFGVTDVVPEYSDWYDDFKEVFKPLGEDKHAQELVDFVNALIKAALSDLIPSAIDTLHAKVPDYAKHDLNPVLTALDDLLKYRQTFNRETNKDKVLSDSVKNVNFELTKAYMNTIVTAMQEVIEYNDTHDNKEKSEGYEATKSLWQGQLRTDMQEYLDNGIPDIIVTGEPYEYINSGKLNVIASVQDSNDTTHDVEVIFNGVTKKLTTTDGKVNVTFDLADGYYEDYVTIIAKDKLTKKVLLIKNKPVVAVSDVETYKRFVQALEADKKQSFDAFDLTTHTSLKSLYNKTLDIKVNVSSEREIREVENSATKLGGKNGQLEILVKSLVQNNRLEWLINNYKNATDDDFKWAGVKGVTPSNIDSLKTIIDDYVMSHEGGPVKTPTVEDYENWLNLSEVIEEARKAIVEAEEIHSKEQLAAAIANSEDKLEKVPTWLTVKKELRGRLDAIIAYYNIIDSVLNAETTYQQADKDVAQKLLDKLTDSTVKEKLQERLDAVQTVIDASSAVSTAETTLEESDQLAAQKLVNAIDTNNKIKKELQNRLDALTELKDATAAVELAESSNSQTDKDSAQLLVKELPESPKKEELQSRLDAIQDVIDNKSKEDQSKDAVSKAEDTLQQQDKDKAQEKVNTLQEGDLKNELQERLDTLQKNVDAYLTAEKTVNQAEISKAKIDIDSAQQLVDVLPASTAKTKLQKRLDAVSQYVRAEEVVSKGESSLIQKHKNDAQVLVDALPNGDDKQALQKRLDALQLAIDNKKEDLLDKIINNLDNVTSQELADYINDENLPVYEELLPEYKEAIDKLGDTVTKEQVIQVIKLVNAIEIAKRTMQKSDIAAYENEYAASTLPTIKSYPQPTVFNSIVDYLQDDNALGNVIKELAVALKVTEDEIRAEVEKILKDVSEDAITGKYLVQYLNANGDVIFENWVTDVQYGEIVVTGEAPEGYEIVGEIERKFTLSDDTANQTITFIVKENVKNEDSKVDETDVEATTPEKEQQQPNENEDVEKVPGNETHTEEVPAEDNTLADTVSESDIDIKKLSVDEIKTLKPELNTVKDSAFEQYIKHVQDYAAEKEVETFTKEELNILLSTIHAAYEQDIEAESKISKLTEGPVKKVLMDLIKPKTTIGKESALVRSKMQVASLNDNYVRITSTPYTGEIWGTENENHAEYVFKTFYALASVKSYKATPSEKYKEEVKDYIVVNLHDGSYKEMLLAELGYKITEIGTADDGKPDLTVVKPTPKPVEPAKPPVVEPPVTEPPVVDPPVVKPPTVVDPPVINPNPQPKPEPPVVVPPKTGTTAETIDYENGKWIIKNPSKDSLTVEQDGIKIKIPLEIKSKQWSVEWLNKGNNHYKLRIWADGKEISAFKQQIEITKEQKKAYVLRHENDEYKAVPFKFVKPNQISFKTNRTGEFYFSTKQVKFKDIEGVYSKDAIEELANRHIVFGTSPGYYSPNNPLTRAQFCAMLVRSLGLEATGTNTFKDVKAKDWFASDVQALYGAGIIKGVSATKFNPNGTLTRQQAALMLERTLDYLNVKKESYSLNFADADKISEDAKSAVAVMQGLGIFTGKPGDVFDPYSNLTRAQMAKVLLKTLEITDVF